MFYISSLKVSFKSFLKSFIIQLKTAINIFELGNMNGFKRIYLHIYFLRLLNKTLL